MGVSDEVYSLAVRRGYFWYAYEIYGGVSGLLTWGPLGVRLKRNIVDYWTEFFVSRHGFVMIDTPILAPFEVFEASGHVESFRDLMAVCEECGSHFKADALLEERGVTGAEGMPPSQVDELIEEREVVCPLCGGTLGETQHFGTMFDTSIGPKDGTEGFLRPETAQGMFTEFKRVYTSQRKKMPLGVAQVGRGFRNEISPRKGPIRQREFDMMEIEVFYDPETPECPYIDDVEEDVLRLKFAGDSATDEEISTHTVAECMDLGYLENEWLAYFMALSLRFIESLGVPREKQRLREKGPAERAHYARATWDHEVLLADYGWTEVAGHADRTAYDLSQHSEKGVEELEAERRLDEPRERTTRTLRPRYEVIKDEFPEEAASVLETLNERGREDLLRTLTNHGEVEVGGVTLRSRHFDVREETVTEHVETYTPVVAEPSFGLDRISYAALQNAYGEKGDRTVLSLPPRVAPYTAAVFPLVERDDFREVSTDLVERLRAEGWDVVYHEKGSIGRRYARADEIGIPVAFTVDEETLTEGSVTARDRDSWDQVRISAQDAAGFVERLLREGEFQRAAEAVGYAEVKSTS